MMCYRDRIYCTFYKTCNNGKTCNRALTEEIEKDAERVNLGISKFVDKPDCYEEI